VLGLVFALGSMFIASAEDHMADEYRVKAAFLFNFAKFVEWPATSFTSNDQPIEICILGQNPFGTSLEDAVRGKVAANRTFIVREVSSAQQAGNCHILFVGVSERKRSRAVLGELKGASVLTVGETEDFTATGGVISFKLKDGRVRFEIDPAAAERGNLRISSKLLSLAEIRKR
jgi:hypothetical protein